MTRLAALLVLLLGCSAEAPAVAAAAAGPPLAAAAPAPKLDAYAASPTIDLVANRYRWHQYADGLVIALASPGYAKYSQEYAQPWKAAATVDGKPGRTLGARGGALRFPWLAAGDAVLRLRVHGGAAGQRVTLRVNGRSLNATLAAGWQILDVPVPEGGVRKGENELGIIAARPGTVWHSIEVLPVGAPASTAWPDAEPIAKVNGLPSLRGRWAIPVELPDSGALVLSVSGSGRARVVARPVRGEDKVLLETTAGAAWQEHAIPVGPLAGELVWLELAGDAGVAWGAPRILVPKATSLPRPPPARNAVLWVVDALRSDRLPLYNETRVQMPNLVAAAKAGGVWFPHNQAASPSSPPSHGSVQTGMIPRVHGVDGDKGQVKPGTPTISTTLGDAGIATGYFGNNPFGMARHQKHGRWTSFHQPGMEGKSNDCVALVKMMLEFAREQHAAGKRFFISSLPYEPHTPYLYNPGITEKYYDGPYDEAIGGKAINGQHLEALMGGKVPMTDARRAQLLGLYDGDVEKSDVCFGQLLAGLREIGVADDTLVVLTSDHGEGMFEHGKLGHAFGTWRELGDVPLVLIGRGLVQGAGRGIEVVTGHVDIAPTIIDLMGVKVPEAMQGMSLAALVQRQGASPPRVMSLEYGRSYGLRARRWSLVVGYDGKELVYDNVADPTQQKDLSGDAAAWLATRYLRDSAGFFLAHRSSWKAATFGAYNDHAPGFVAFVGGK